MTLGSIRAAARTLFVPVMLTVLVAMTGYQLLTDASAPTSTSRATQIDCPTAPGFAATRSQHDMHRNCVDARKVQELLIERGALGAEVSVTSHETGSLLGPTQERRVVAQVFMSDADAQTWDAAAARVQIARAVGTSASNVTVADANLMTRG